MNVKNALPLILACSLAACQPAGKDANGQPTGVIGKALDQASKGLQQASKEMDDAQKEIDQAKQKLASENLSLNRGHVLIIQGHNIVTGHGQAGLAKAEITPAGDLLIDGKAVATTPEQKQLVLAYRAQLIGIASAGIAIGMEGAKVGIDAAASVLASLAGGGSADAAGKQAAQSAKERIKPQVEKLCGQLPDLLKAQQALAATLPEFRPYASMTESDVKDCTDKQDWNF
ncbi:MAG: hypothetical protein QM601_04530 [Pseudoxanthomonas sp.]